METGKFPAKLVFGLDIGTRSIVGTVGYRVQDDFNVVAMAQREHKSRAMMDGQIHDIGQVAETIREVKEELSEKVGFELSDVCIAAAGRVLKTVEVHVDQEFEDNRAITKEEIYSLETAGVEKAYENFQGDDSKEKFYCVGYSVTRYFMNDYPIGNLEDHKARKIGADMIATFLPDDVVDGLYKAVEMADLQVVNLTLEPIAAIQVAIPPMYRMLNIALVDVGAGTSDISITKEGSIVAYGMIPIAGDGLTECIATHCLVDFATAEGIKKGISSASQISYKDIMGITQKISREEVIKLTQPIVSSMAKQVAEKIKELNGGKSVSAVFVVGGGGKIAGYEEALAKELGIPTERVALRGEEVMGRIHFEQNDIEKDSLLVTPVGICLSFYNQSNSFIYLTFNHQRVKLYDNSHLAVVDAALQADFSNYDLFPKRGNELHFTINGKEKTVRGSLGEAAVIKVNGVDADITSPVRSGDVIIVTKSTAGEDAHITVSELAELNNSLSIVVDGKNIDLKRFAVVKGEIVTDGYEICENDDIEIRNFYTVSQIMQFLDIPENSGKAVKVNHELATPDTKVYENFTVEFMSIEENWKEIYSEDSSDFVSDEDNARDEEGLEESITVKAEKAPENKAKEPELTMTVIVNNNPVKLSGKSSYIFVDVFDYIDFDLSNPRGKAVVTKLNGNRAGYVDALHEGDTLSIYWSDEQ